MAICLNFIMTLFLIFVFLFIECHSGIVLKNFKSRRTVMDELEKEIAEAKSRFDDISNVIKLPIDQIKPSHINVNSNKPSDRISPRMKDETKTSKKPKIKGSLKFKNVTEIINSTEKERKLSKQSNDFQSTKPNIQAKIDLRNQTKPLKLPKDETLSKVTNKTSNSAERHIVDGKVLSKTGHGKSSKHENSLESTNTSKIADRNVTKTVNRTLTVGGNSTITSFVHVNVTNGKPNVSEIVHLKNSSPRANITEVVHLNVTMAAKPNVTEVVQLNFTRAELISDDITANLNITEVSHSNFTKTVMPELTEVLHLNITEAEMTNTVVEHLNFTMRIKPNVSEVLHLNFTEAVQPNATELRHLNVKITINPNVTEAVKSNSTNVVHLNVTETKSTVNEFAISNVTKRANTNSKPEVSVTKINSKRESSNSFVNSSMKGKDSHVSKNLSGHVNGHLRNLHSVSSHLNKTTLNETVNIPSVLNPSDLKEVSSVVNNSVNVVSMSLQDFNSSLSNSLDSIKRSVNMVNKENSLVLKDSTLITQKVPLNKTSDVPVQGMKQFSHTDKDFNGGSHEPVSIHKDQKNISDSKDLISKVGNTEELKVKINETDKLKETISVPQKIRENTNFLETQHTSNSKDEVTNMNVDVSKPFSENLNISDDPTFNFSLHIPLSLEGFSNSTILEPLGNFTKVILTDETNAESRITEEKSGNEMLNKFSDNFLINETNIVGNTQNKPSKKEIFNFGNEKVDKNKNESNFSELTKMDNKGKAVESEMVTMVLVPEESNSTQSVSGLDFLVNSEVAKNAVLAMEVFNLSDTSLTDHVIEDSDIHSFIEIMMPSVSDSHHEEALKLKISKGTEEHSNISAQRTAEVETFPLNETSETKRNESVVEIVGVPSNDSQFQDIEMGITNSTEIIEVLKCPRPGLCLFWFASRDTCTHHNQCLPSQLCCKVRCSKHCIDAEPQHD